jgi:Glucodextranase, domain B
MALLRPGLALTSSALALLVACKDRGLDEDGPDDRDEPTLTIDAPERASLLDDGTRVRVIGRATDATGGAIDRVEVNGAPAEVGDGGSFVADVEVGAGITLIHTVARDAAGNEARDTRAVMAGQFAPLEQPIESAFAAWLSADAIDAVGDTAAAFVAGQDLGALVAPFNPVLTAGGDCLGARVSVVDVDLSESRISLAPAAGSLALVVELDDLDVPLDVAFDVACVGGTVGARLTATRFTVEASLAADASEGAFAIEIASAEARFEGFQLDVGLVPGEIVDLIASDLDETIADQLTARLDELVLPRLDAALAGLAAGTSFELFGQEVTVALGPRELAIEESGARLVLDATVTAAGADAGALPGYLSSPGPLPALGSEGEDGFALAVADDAANQALAAFTAAGGLDRILPVGGGEYGEVGELFDRIHIAAPLPPTVSAGPDGLVLTAGDLRVDFEKDEAGGTVSTTSLALSASARVDLVVAESGAIRLAVSEPEVHADFEEASGANSLARPEIERLGSFAGGRVIGALGSLIGEVPVPSVLGLSVTDLAVAPAPDAAGYLVASGRLVAPLP